MEALVAEANNDIYDASAVVGGDLLCWNVIINGAIYLCIARITFLCLVQEDGGGNQTLPLQSQITMPTADHHAP